MEKFAEAGYDTAVIYNNSESAAACLSEAYGTVCYKCNLASSGELENTLSRISLDFPNGFDVIVNNAAISQHKMICDISDSDWDSMLAVNLTAPFKIIRHFSQLMIRKGRGRIINVSSVWGEHGASCETHYSAAKAGLIGLTKAVAKELAPSGILVNCVCPGVIDTDMNNNLSEIDKNALEDEIPLGRIGKAEEVAECVFFLSELSSSYVTGQVISPNGGFGV